MPLKDSSSISKLPPTRCNNDIEITVLSMLRSQPPLPLRFTQKSCNAFSLGEYPMNRFNSPQPIFTSSL